MILDGGRPKWPSSGSKKRKMMKRRRFWPTRKRRKQASRNSTKSSLRAIIICVSSNTMKNSGRKRRNWKPNKKQRPISIPSGPKSHAVQAKTMRGRQMRIKVGSRIVSSNPVQPCRSAKPKPPRRMPANSTSPRVWSPSNHSRISMQTVWATRPSPALSDLTGMPI